MKAVSIALVCVCGCMTPPIQFGAGKSSEEAQQQRIGALMPPQLAAERRWHGDVHVAKVRVWADDDYRAQNMRWERGFQESLDYANSVLEPMLGLRLVAEYRSWPHHAVGDALADDIAALAHVDAGDGVFTVIGLTSALGLASATFDAIGYGSLPGRYIVLRGYADVAERQSFDRAFPKIPADERQAVHEARRRHKLTAVLLHELGHNLGAPHADAEDTIMSAMYSDHSATFDERSRDLMIATVAGRLGRPLEHEVKVAPGAVAVRHATVVVGITATGDLVIGGRTIDAATLGELLKLSATDDADTELVVKASRGAPHTTVIQVLDVAKTAGLRRMSIDASDAP